MGRSPHRLIVFSILGFLGLAAVFIFFLIRLDPDHYRSYLESQLSRALHLKVELGNLSRSWNRGLGLRVNGLELREDRDETPLFRADSLVLWLDPFSLAGGHLVYKARMEGGDFHYRGGTRHVPIDLELKGIRAQVRQEIPGGKIEGGGEARVLSDLTSDLTWRGTVDPKSHEVDFEVRFQKDQAILKGEARPLQKPLRFQTNLELQELDLATVGGPLGGVASGNVEVAGVGRSGIEIRKSLQGKGELEIRNGVFRNFNVLNAVLRRITVVPALGEALVVSVPANFQPLLNRQDTPFELLQSRFVIQEDQLAFREFLLKDRQYLIEAEGTFGFQGEVNFRAKLILMEEMSQFLVGRVKELAPLRNVKGRLVIPFVYRGTWPGARPRPDLNYLAEKLLVEQGRQLMERGLEALSQHLGKPSQ